MVLAAGRKDAGASMRSIGFGALVRELSEVATTGEKHQARGVAELKREVTGIIRRDYGQALRQCLSRWEVKEIAGEGKNRVWPGLNRQPVTLVTPKEFVRRWSAFGVDFKFASLPPTQGTSLLGFYVNKIDGIRRRPLIFVNTAHHPGLVGLALDHEMGHHLTAEIFAAGEGTHLLSQTGFDEHLAEPAELAADTLVSLAFIPAPVARTIFSSSKRTASQNRPHELSDLELAEFWEYIANRYSSRLDQVRGVNKRFQALAALVHYAKLRRALLDEYNT